MKILAAYKPSAEGEAVLREAVAMAKTKEAQILIFRYVHSETNPSSQLPGLGSLQAKPDEPAVNQQSRDRSSGQEVRKLREEMETLASGISSEGVECESVLLAGQDDVAEELVRFADEEQIDLIVLGVRRRSRVGKAILGSESQQVILSANCPVLAVKAD